MELQWSWRCLAGCLLCLIFHPLLSVAYEVVYAVNCGGGRHTDRFGVRYSADDASVGIPSEFGRSLMISRVHPDDSILYQTERYHTTTFSYTVPISEDGDYVLIAKFAEVYFEHPGQKIFDIVLNSHVVVQDLDIFAVVGRANAHDEVVGFSIRDDNLLVNGESSPFDGTLNIKFAKGPADNPKVNAIVLIKGPVGETELPALPPPVHQQQQQQHEGRDGEAEWGDNAASEQHFKRTSGPKAHDPYTSDDSWFMPITLAIAVFLPVLFCLCRVR